VWWSMKVLIVMAAVLTHLLVTEFMTDGTGMYNVIVMNHT
jgi:hypothetical protein